MKKHTTQNENGLTNKEQATHRGGNKSALKTFIISVLLVLSIFCSNMSFGQSTATYTITSTSAVTTSGTAPSGSSATYSQTYTTAKQITSGKTATLTLSGYAGYKITSIVLSMHSNASAGAGSLSVVAGSTTIASVPTATAFSNASWYGSYTSSYVNVTKTPTVYTVQTGESVVITITGSTNSLFIQSYAITYEAATAAPSITSSLTATGTVGSAFSYTITGSNTPTSYNATGLPAGLSINTSTGVISGTPTTAATTNVTISATNATGTGSATLALTVNAAATSKKILWDGLHAETESSADWCVDADTYVSGWNTSGTCTTGSEGTPQQTPTPAQSGITSGTTEDYWTGGNSAWAVALAKAGYTIESLTPCSGAITYGNGSNAQDLSNYSVFIVNEPNTVFTAAEKQQCLIL